MGCRAVVAENEDLGDGSEAGGGLVQLDQEELICEDIPVVTAENVNFEDIPVAADSQNLEDEIESAPMEIDVIVDEVTENEVEQAEMETSLILNLSSISDAPEEESNHDDGKKKKFNLFVKPGKDNVVQAIKPGPDNEKSKTGSAKKQQNLPKKQVKEKKVTQNKKGKKRDNETTSPVKSKRKTKVPAKFLDGIDFSKDDETETPSLSSIRTKRNERRAAKEKDIVDPDWCE